MTAVGTAQNRGVGWWLAYCWRKLTRRCEICLSRRGRYALRSVVGTSWVCDGCWPTLQDTLEDARVYMVRQRLAAKDAE